MSTCCVGHECDNCPICLAGTCCKRDLPNRQLPPRGAWPFTHGDLGEIVRDENGIQCHACGEMYSALGMHVRHKHDLNAAEYRALFGLSQKHPLVSESVSAALRVSMQRNREVSPEVFVGAPVSTLTKEQRQEISFRAVTRLDPECAKRIEAAVADYTNKPSERIIDIAHAHGVAPQTLSRELKNRGVFSDRLRSSRHGSLHMYARKGCRCEECRATNAAFSREQRARKKQREMAAK